MMGRRRTSVWVLALATAWAPASSAQTCTTPTSASSLVRTCSVTVSSNAPIGDWVVNRLGEMTLSSVATLVLTSPGTAAYDVNTLQEPVTNVRTVTVKANAPWNVTVSPNTVGTPSYWSTAADGTYGAFVAPNSTKPSSNLQVSLTLGSGYLSLPTSNAGTTTLLSAQPVTASYAFTVYFATTWFYQFDTPGTYTLPFQFTLSVP